MLVSECLLKEINSFLRLQNSVFLNDQKGKRKWLLAPYCTKYSFISNTQCEVTRLVLLSHFLNLSSGRSVHQRERRMLSDFEFIVKCEKSNCVAFWLILIKELCVKSMDEECVLHTEHVQRKLRVIRKRACQIHNCLIRLLHKVNNCQLSLIANSQHVLTQKAGAIPLKLLPINHYVGLRLMPEQGSRELLTRCLSSLVAYLIQGRVRVKQMLDLNIPFPLVTDLTQLC